MKTCPIGCPRNPEFCADCEPSPAAPEKNAELRAVAIAPQLAAAPANVPTVTPPRRVLNHRSTLRAGFRLPREHELKTWPDFFAAVESGAKPFEMRKNDRDFRTGDALRLREWSQATGYTGRELRVVITYVLSDPAFGTQPGFAVLGIASADAAKDAEFKAARIAGLEAEVQTYTARLAELSTECARLREAVESGRASAPVNVTPEELLSEGFSIQPRFAPEPVYGKTGTGFLRPSGVDEIAEAKAREKEKGE